MVEKVEDIALVKPGRLMLRGSSAFPHKGVYLLDTLGPQQQQLPLLPPPVPVLVIYRLESYHPYIHSWSDAISRLVTINNASRGESNIYQPLLRGEPHNTIRAFPLPS